MQGKYSHYINKKKIRLELFKNDLSYKAIAKKMGFKSPSTFKHLVDGYCEPTISKMVTLSKILEQPIDVLFNLKV